ncbi:MAG: dTMP kinase [Chloroflexi bacterium]|nr:dTMP kinase [Chloroflexota bacterium]
MRGRFITFEGPEGGGKSTQSRLLQERLERAGIALVHTREPGGTPIGKELRAMLLAPERPAPTPVAQVLLLSADRAQHVAEVIRPALAAGKTVISDRFFDATLAYQGYGEGLDLEMLGTITRFATGGLVPDLTVLVEIDVAVGLERKRAAFRDGSGELNRIDRRDLTFHQRVREGYLTLAEAEPARFLVVDGTRPLEEIAERIWQRVRGLLVPSSEFLVRGSSFRDVAGLGPSTSNQELGTRNPRPTLPRR